MNETIERIFSGFEVDGTEVPVSFMYYRGNGEPYVIYMQQDADGSLSGDDQLIGYADYYDFDIYAKGNYLRVLSAVRQRLERNGFVWQPSRSGADMFEPETGYYHKTLNFGILREET